MKRNTESTDLPGHLAQIDVLPGDQPRLALKVLALIADEPGLKVPDLVERLADDPGSRKSATVFKAVETLKMVGLLPGGRATDGYRLTLQLSDEERRMVLNGLRIQAKDLHYPKAEDLARQLEARCQAHADDDRDYSFEGILNRPLIRLARAEYEGFLDELRTAMRLGQQVRLVQVLDHYAPNADNREHLVFPLQLLFHGIAWYLLAEDAVTGCFRTIRLDRVRPMVELVPGTARGRKATAARWRTARKVLSYGWATALPPHEPDGTLIGKSAIFRVRFSAEVAPFIQRPRDLNPEARWLQGRPERHPAQKVSEPDADGAVVFTVKLHWDDANRRRGVWKEFKRWVLSWGADAVVLGPSELRDEIRRDLSGLLLDYADDATAEVERKRRDVEFELNLENGRRDMASANCGALSSAFKLAR